MILSAILLVSCGSSGKVAQKPVKTYVQPGADLLDAPDVLRAWAVGVSNSEMTAKKKANSLQFSISKMNSRQVTAAISGFQKHPTFPQKAGIPPAQELQHTLNSPTKKAARNIYISTLILTTLAELHRSTVQK
jgi:hypothetical protein